MKPASDQPVRDNSVTSSTSSSSSPAKGPVTIKKRVPFIIAGILLLLIGVALTIAASSDKKGVTKNNPEPANQPEKKIYKAFTATRLTDLDKVCDGEAAVNTTDYSTGPSPHPIMLFTPSNLNDNKLVEEIIVFKEKGWRPLYSKVDATQLVGCFKRASLGASKKCDIKSGGQFVTVDFFSVNYELTVREAKTGKSLGTKKVNGLPDESCPFFPDFDKSDPKMYGTPDDGQTEEALREFVTS